MVGVVTTVGLLLVLEMFDGCELLDKRAAVDTAAGWPAWFILVMVVFKLAALAREDFEPIGMVLGILKRVQSFT